MVRDGISTLLRAQQDMEVTEVEDGRAAVQVASELSPDVVVMDLFMPELNGIDAPRRIIDENPRVKVVALSAHTDGGLVQQAFQAGASAFVPKRAAFEELATAVRAVMADRLYLS